MAAGVDDVVKGSFDDVPDAELRTVLAIPLSVPPAPPAPRQIAHHSRPSHHRKATAGIIGTVWVGLGAAATVLVAVVLLLLLVHLGLD